MNLSERVGPGGLTRRKFLRGVGAAGTLMMMGPVGGKMSQAYGQSLPVPGPADWPSFGYDLQNTRFNVRESRLGRDNVSRLKLKWSFQADGVIQTTPTVIGDTLFFGSQSGQEFALETRTGEPRWRFGVEKQEALRYMRQGVRSSSYYSDGRVYFGDGTTKVRCLDAATGAEIWQTQLTDDPTAQTRSSPAVYNGRVVLGILPPAVMRKSFAWTPTPVQSPGGSKPLPRVPVVPFGVHRPLMKKSTSSTTSRAAPRPLCLQVPCCTPRASSLMTWRAGSFSGIRRPGRVLPMTWILGAIP